MDRRLTEQRWVDGWMQSIMAYSKLFLGKCPLMRKQLSPQGPIPALHSLPGTLAGVSITQVPCVDTALTPSRLHTAVWVGGSAGSLPRGSVSLPSPCADWAG